MKAMTTNGQNGANGQPEDRAPARFEWLSVAAALLVVTLLVSMVAGIRDTVRGLDNQLPWIVTGVALLLGLLISRMATRVWSSILLALSSGLLFVPMNVGRLWDDWEKVWYQLQFWSGLVVKALIEELPLPSLGSILYTMGEFSTSMVAMFSRLVRWFWRFPRMNDDMIATMLVWSLAIWLAAIWASWFVWRRNRPLEAAIPAFLLLGMARSYAGESPGSMFLLLGVTIALLVLVGQMQRERDWSLRNIGFSEAIRKNSTQAAMALSAVLVIAATATTSIDFDEIRDRWREYQEQKNRTSASLGERGDTVPASGSQDRDDDRVTLYEQFADLSRGGLPNSLLIDSGPELSEEVVMRVHVEEIDPVTGNPLPAPLTNKSYYLRGLTYDYYTPQGWYTPGSRIYVYEPEQAAINTYTDKQRLIKQEVTYEDQTRGIIHVVGELAVVNQQYNVAWREGKGLSTFRDMFGATVQSSTYEAYSLVPTFRQADLREAYQDYPDWVLNNYLQLPVTVPQRVLDLAYELTYRELNVYDQAVAIERYLRTFPYTLDLPIKPANRDIADYFLFELKTGYCDYYATTMVVLARAAGLPARLAVGYLSGEYDIENEVYVVTADLAHSWAEIYFPEYGWVAFEPTAGRAPVERAEQMEALPEFERQITYVEETEPLSIFEIIRRALLVALAAAVLAFLVWLQVDLWRLHRNPTVRVFTQLYQRMQWFADRLGVVGGQAQTPLEFSAEMAGTLKSLGGRTRLLRYLPKTADQVTWLVGKANQAAFSLEPPGVIERTRAIRDWASLRWQLGLALAWRWLAAFLPRKRRKMKD